VISKPAKKSKKEQIFILDTKWKILDENDKNKGVSQADMYQMFAYSKKYALDLEEENKAQDLKEKE